jgi:hypothetical protein
VVEATRRTFDVQLKNIAGTVVYSARLERGG